jgi:hypothetical protein
MLVPSQMVLIERMDLGGSEAGSEQGLSSVFSHRQA